MTGMFVDGINGIRILVRLMTDRMLTSTAPVDANAMLKALNTYQDWFKDYQRALFHTADILEVRVPQVGEADGAEKSPGGVARIMGAVLAGQMLFFAFYTGAYSMMSILREDEEGTLARLFTTPTNRTVILAGKFLAVVLMVLVQAGVMLGVGALAFKIHWGQPLSILMAVVGQVAAASGLGVLLISLVKTTNQAGPVLGGGLTMLGMLGGLFTSNVDMPESFTRLAVLTPQGWANTTWKIALTGAPASELALHCAVLLGMGVVMFAAGAVIFRRRFA
jgi:ABC-type multidrug transport system permease subunit